jgi:methyl-accepting chemotaxis protein
MKHKIIIYIGLITLSLTAWMTPSMSQTKKENSTTEMAQTPIVQNAVKSKESAEDDGLGEKDKLVLEVAKSLVESCKAIMEKWVSSNEIIEEKLFSFLYFPIPDSNPKKFNTDYDKLSDRDIQSVLEAHLGKQPDIIYTVMTDKNGYVPTHNKKYTLPLTGDKAKDLVGNRTKRIYADKTGLAAARNQEPFLLQSYKRDTGQIMVDLSIPIFINKRHWGAVRIGYLK